MAGLTFSPYTTGSSFALSTQFANLQRYSGGVSSFSFNQVNAYTGYIVGNGSFGQLNLFVNPSNPFGNAKQYLSYSGLDPATAQEVMKIIDTEAKRKNKGKALEIIKVIFEGIGKVTEFVKAWKGQNGVAAEDTSWQPSQIDSSGATGGVDFPTTIPDTTQQTTQQNTLFGFTYTEVGIGAALAYLLLKK